MIDWQIDKRTPYVKIARIANYRGEKVFLSSCKSYIYIAYSAANDYDFCLYDHNFVYGDEYDYNLQATLLQDGKKCFESALGYVLRKRVARLLNK